MSHPSTFTIFNNLSTIIYTTNSVKIGAFLFLKRKSIYHITIFIPFLCVVFPSESICGFLLLLLMRDTGYRPFGRSGRIVTSQLEKHSLMSLCEVFSVQGSHLNFILYFVFFCFYFYLNVPAGSMSHSKLQDTPPASFYHDQFGEKNNHSLINYSLWGLFQTQPGNPAASQYAYPNRLVMTFFIPVRGYIMLGGNKGICISID